MQLWGGGGGAGPYEGFFHHGGSKAYMPKKVPNIERVINNDILKIGGGDLQYICSSMF